MSSLPDPISRRDLDDVHVYGTRRDHFPVAGRERAALGQRVDLADRLANEGRA